VTADPAPSPRFDRRACGVLLHPTSLAGSVHNGDLGAEAARFVDFLHRARQSWWQMLPINPPGCAPGYSPYSSCSAFAGSPWLISLQPLVEQGLLGQSDLAGAGTSSSACDFRASIRYRQPRLRKAFARFQEPLLPDVANRHQFHPHVRRGAGKGHPSPHSYHAHPNRLAFSHCSLRQHSTLNTQPVIIVPIPVSVNISINRAYFMVPSMM